MDTKPRYKLVNVRHGPPAPGVGWAVKFDVDYKDCIVDAYRRYVRLKDGGVMILRPLLKHQPKIGGQP